MEKDYLVLKRASASRPSGEGNDDDYDVLAEHAEHGKLLINLLAEEHSYADKNGKHRLVIEAYGYRWFRVGGLDYLLRRTDIDQPAKQSGA